MWNYNESDLLTCFSLDFGYEKWVEKCIEYYGDEEDVVILISAGGNSQNMLNGAKKAKKKNCQLLPSQEMMKTISYLNLEI